MTFSPVFGSSMSSAVVRPSTRSASEAMTAPPWTIAASRAPLVPQSSSMITAFWRHVDKTAGQVTRFAVLSAVSARPLRAPWVELKYSRTVSLP